MIKSCAAIVIAAKHGELIKVKDASGIAYTVGTLRCKFDFRTTDWDYTTRTAVFCKGNVSTNPKVVDTAIGVLLDGVDECAVPPEVLLPDEKYFSVGVWGVTGEGLRIVSEWLVFSIKDGCYVDSTESFLPTPSAYEQIMMSLNLKAPIDHKHEEYVTETELADKGYVAETDIEDIVKECVKEAAIPDSLSDLSEDAMHRTVTDAEKQAWDNKVDKVYGKGLSTNDYTNEEKEKLATLSAGGGGSNIMNIEDGTGAGSIQQKLDTLEVDFTNRNPNTPEGLKTTLETGAIRPASVSLNGNTMARGERSLAVNNKTIAAGDESLAQGYQSIAYGNSSFAGGSKTLAEGEASASLGVETVAKGKASLAEGSGSKAIGDNSHAGGDRSIATGDNSYAGGTQSKANATGAFAHGYQVETNVDYGAVFGRMNIPQDDGLFIVGNGSYNVEQDEEQPSNAFIVWKDGRASAYSAPQDPWDVVRLQDIPTLKQGTNTNSVTMPGNSSAEGSHAIALGQEVHANGEDSFAQGTFVTANGHSAFAAGYNSTTNADRATAIGYNVTAGYEDQTVIGAYNSNKEDTLFEVGNGDENRSGNAFEVYQNGDAKVYGNLSVTGDLNVTGTTTTKDTETVMVKDNTLVANSDGIELLEEAGFAIKTNETEAYGIMYDPLGDGVKIGLGGFTEDGKFVYNEGQAQFLATRADKLDEGHIPKWDSQKNQFVDSGVGYNEYVKFTDYPVVAHGGLGISAKAGVVKIDPYYGITVGQAGSEGTLIPSWAGNTEIDNKSGHRFINPQNLDYATMKSLSDCKAVDKSGNSIWTDDTTVGSEVVKGTKTKARELLGAVGFTDYAENTKAGVVKVSYGNPNSPLYRNGNGTLLLGEPSQDEIKGKTVVKAISPKNQDYAWKMSATDNKEEWTDEDKANACKTIGAATTKYVDDLVGDINTALEAILGV